MEATGCSLEDALADAQARGYAEADPSFDLDGADAAAKLSIVCALAFGLQVDPSRIETRSAFQITAADVDAARRRGGTIRQVAHAEYDRATLTAWVAPVIVPRGSIFSRTIGARNAAIITGAYSGDIAIAGAGAGGDATAVAILSDLVAIARDPAAIVPPPNLSVPRAIVGFNSVQRSDDLITTSNAKVAKDAEDGFLGGLSDLCDDRRIEAEAM